MFLISMGSCTALVLPSNQGMVHRWKGYTKHMIENHCLNPLAIYKCFGSLQLVKCSDDLEL